jgi:hypothetical protein
MAKKSKRQAARKQQRPTTRPVSSPGSGAPASVPPQTTAQDLDDEAFGAQDDQDYAATAIPVSESDGPMPLPPAEAGTGQQRPAAATATATSERRRVGRLDPAAVQQQRPGQKARGGPRSTAAMFEPLPPDDAAIPFDRVPYVPGDLRRVLVIAALMIVLIVVADIVVSSVVK